MALESRSQKKIVGDTKRVLGCIFGSYARGEQKSDSDIDILVTYSEGADLLLVAGLRRYLRRKLHIKVDVISKKYLNPVIKDHVLNEAIPV